MLGRKLAEKYWDKVAYPALVRPFAVPLARAAIGLFGSGSEVRGWDDDLSLDGPRWPRLDFILMPEDYPVWAGRMREALGGLPADPDEPQHENPCRVLEIDDYFKSMVGVERAPLSRRAWRDLPQDKLFEVVNDFPIQDPVGEYTQRVAEFREYFPESVWTMKLMQGCRELAPLEPDGNRIGELNKAVRRNDPTRSHALLGLGLIGAMRLGFLAERTYAPGDKWLFRALDLLPQQGAQLRRLAIEASEPNDWESRARSLWRIFDLVKEAVAGLGVVDTPPSAPFSVFAEALKIKYQRLAMGD